MAEQNTLFLYLFIWFLMVFLVSFIPNKLFASTKSSKLNISNSILYWGGALAPICVYAIFWGLREDVGTDYYSYVLFFNEAEARLDFSTEYAFIYLCMFLKHIGFDAISLFVVTSFISVFTIFMVARNFNKRFLTSLICFYILISCLYSLNGVRSAMAYSIFMVALSFFCKDKNNRAPFILIFLLSFFIHHTTILLFMLVLFLKFLRRIEINLLFLVVIYILCELLGIKMQNFFFVATQGLTVLLGYGDQISYIEIAKEGDLGFMVLLRIMLSFITFYAYNKYYNKSGKKDFIYYSFFIFIVGLFLSRIFVGSLLLMRVAKVFSYLGFIIVAFSFSSLVSSRSLRDRLLGYFLLIGHVVTFSIHILGNSNGVTPYFWHTSVFG